MTTNLVDALVQKSQVGTETRLVQWPVKRGSVEKGDAIVNRVLEDGHCSAATRS